ncbi:uncharacterized protein RJT21DRAFT_115248 [Scheffersomyces amazonensis]|uniref:uncharacterized protein n=1 Tax=Scheffersomyces amazonensis TaxID=1078765 RepID=UPI00315D2002
MESQPLDDFINFDSATRILAEHFARGDMVHPLEIHRQGKPIYDQQKKRLNEYLDQVNDTDLLAFLGKYRGSNELQRMYTKKDCIMILFELHNFHQLHFLPFANTKDLSKVITTVKMNLIVYTYLSNSNFPVYFTYYMNMNFFLRIEPPKIEIEVKASSDIRDHHMKSLIGNFFPESNTLINYEPSVTSTFRIYMSRLEGFELSYEYPYDGEKNSESDIKSYFTSNVLNPLCKLLKASLRRVVSYHSEKQGDLIDGTPSVSDITIGSFNVMNLPIKLNRFSLGDYFNTQNVDSVIGFNENFSSVLLHCLSLDSFVGILSNSSEMIALDFRDSIPSNEFYQLEEGKILRKISCDMHKLTSPLQMLLFINNSLQSPQQLEQTKPLLQRLKIKGKKKEFSVNSLYKNLNNGLFQLLSAIHKGETHPCSQLDVASQSILTNQFMHDILGALALNTKRLSEVLRPLEITSSDVIINKFKLIKIVSGGKFGTKNSIVIKVKTRFETDAILKVFDPIRSVSMTVANGEVSKSLAICLKNFSTEVLILNKLRNCEFVPKISEIGVILNSNVKYIFELTIKSPAVTGLFITYPLKGRMLCEFNYHDKCKLDIAVGEVVHKLHQQGVAHLDLNANNIIVEDLESKKVHLIDFGHSYLEYQWPHCYSDDGSTYFEQLCQLDWKAVDKIFKPLDIE